MAKSIGGIVAELLLKDGDFTAKLEKAAKASESGGQRMKKGLAEGSKGFAPSAAAVVYLAKSAKSALDSVVSNLTGAMDAVDKLGKDSDKLGLPTERMAALSLASKIARVESQELAQACKHMTRYAFEAAQGNEQNATTLAQLGISAQEFIKLEPDKQYLALAKALDALGNSNERAGLAQEIFGKDGEAMMPLILEGAKALDEAAQYAEDFGLALSRVDASEVERANKGILLVKEAVEGLFQQLSVHLAPVITDVTERILSQIKEWGGVKTVSRDMMDGIVTGMAVVLRVFDGFDMVWPMMKSGFYGLATVGSTVALIIGSAIEATITLGLHLINKLIDAHNKFSPDKYKWEKFKLDESWTEGLVEAVMVNGAKAADEWAKAMEVLDKPPATDRVIEYVDKVTDQWHKAAEATAATSDKAKTYGAVVTKSMKEATSSVNLLKRELLSLSTIAEKGGNSNNAMYAKKAKMHRDRAEAAEAKGLYGLADSERGMADRAESRIKRRELRAGDVMGYGKREEQRVSNKKVDTAKLVDLFKNGYVGPGQDHGDKPHAISGGTAIVTHPIGVNAPTSKGGAKQIPAASSGAAPNRGGEADVAKLLAQVLQTLLALPTKLGIA